MSSPAAAAPSTATTNSGNPSPHACAHALCAPPHALSFSARESALASGNHRIVGQSARCTPVSNHLHPTALGHETSFDFQKHFFMQHTRGGGVIHTHTSSGVLRVAAAVIYAYVTAGWTISAAEGDCCRLWATEAEAANKCWEAAVCVTYPPSDASTGRPF